MLRKMIRKIKRRLRIIRSFRKGVDRVTITKTQVKDWIFAYELVVYFLKRDYKITEDTPEKLVIEKSEDMIGYEE